MGVNLPAHLVVIKSTRRYIGSEAEDPTGYEEYERSTCLQMVGRAGRPQFGEIRRRGWFQPLATRNPFLGSVLINRRLNSP